MTAVVEIVEARLGTLTRLFKRGLNTVSSFSMFVVLWFKHRWNFTSLVIEKYCEGVGDLWPMQKQGKSGYRQQSSISERNEKKSRNSLTSVLNLHFMDKA